MKKENSSSSSNCVDGRSRPWWAWTAAAALLAVALAIAARSGTAPAIPACECPSLSRNYTGLVEGCGCDFEAADSLNELVLYPMLQELVQTPFFRYFKGSLSHLPAILMSNEEHVKLWCDCPFWPDDGMCHTRDCTVWECPENEFPQPFRKSSSVLSFDNVICQEGNSQDSVDKTLDNKFFRGWIDIDNPWTYDDESDNSAMTYVNLQLNPERYTGYAGASAQRIWTAIYKENCPHYPFEEWCDENKVMYKLISGLHSSISVHIASEYLLDRTTNLWGNNLELLYARVWEHPDRVKNLYFIFLFVLRAVTKAAGYLEQAEYNTGNPIEDLKTQSMVRRLIYDPKLLSSCAVPFDEAKLWLGEHGPVLKQQIQKQFRNVSAVMNCVGCEKCRLWGKLQVNGLATALKVLFSDDGMPLQLQRNEVIALFNLLNRLSESVKFFHDMKPFMKKMEPSGNSPMVAR